MMSSSHLFLGLPIGLLVLYLELRSGLHSAAFFSHLSLGEVAILSDNFHSISVNFSIFFLGPQYLVSQSFCISFLSG